MSKQDSEKHSRQPAPPDAALVDTGKSAEPGPSESPGHPAEEPHGSKGGKPVKVPAAELESLKARAAEAEKLYDQLLRARAEFDNYRKRQVQERQYVELAANEKLFQKLLGVLDTFELALASAQTANSAGAVVEGVQLVRGQLQKALQEAGLEEINAVGKPFDPNLHEAIQQAESADHPDNTVLQQVRKGYRFKDRLLRPATVIVSKRPEPQGNAESASDEL